MGVIMKPKEVSKIIGCSEAKVRQRMKHGDWDLGDAIPPNRKKGEKYWEFNIYPEKLKKQFCLEQLPEKEAANV